MIPYGHQYISQEDIVAVTEVLQSEFLTQGPVLPLFETTVANYCDAKYGVAACNATAALHLACLALDLKKNDWLWTTPISFVASANCGLYCRANIDFVDIDPRTHNISVEKLEEKLAIAEKMNALPKIVIPVHFSGQSCDMAAIHDLSKKYDFKIIEDASHAIGGKYRDAPIGGCQYSDITVFSFHPVKIITTGEGGMATTNSSELAERMKLLRSHGITRNTNVMTHESDGPWYYQQVELGYNYRMSDIQAALGISQMKKLNEFISRRIEIANKYDNSLSGLPLVTPFQNEECDSSYHLYVIRLNTQALTKSHSEIFEELHKEGVGVNVHYIPIHTQPYYKKFGFKQGDFPESERYYSETLSLPIFPTLTDTQQQYVVDTIARVIST